MNRAKGGSHDRSITPSGNAARAPAAGSDFLQLDLDAAPPGGLADWLAERLRLAISDGRLPVGSRLPPSRVLAAELRVSRGVVTEAYRCLSEDGHVAGRGRGGTVVVAAPVVAPDAVPDAVPDAAQHSGVDAASDLVRGAEPVRDADPGTAARAATPGTAGGAGPREAVPPTASSPFAQEPDVHVFEELRAAESRIDLSPGVPDLAAFPRTAWLRAERAVLSTLTPAAFGYGDPRGAPELRRAVADWLARNRGIRADPERMLIVGGVAQALALLAQVLRGEGVEAIAVEEPNSLGARDQLAAWGMTTPPAPVDAEGVRVERLRATGASVVLLTPAHQFPTGVVLGGERRRALMRWARERPERLIVEDDYDAEHRYDRPPVPALRAMLPHQVCYAGSVSKLLAPALRLGWVLPAPRHLRAMVAAKRMADLGSGMLQQLVLARLMASGEMERHLRFLRRRHRQRRDAMIAAIGRHLPGATVHGAAAGLHLTITFDRAGPPDDRALAEAALARGVKVQPLSWHTQLPYAPGLVLGYAARPAGEIAEGIAAVGAALTAVRRAPGRSGARAAR